MSGKENILNELKELNSSLDTSRLNPYQVPVNYFDGLADQVLRKIKALDTAGPQEELSLISPYLSSIDKVLPYQLPKGYFEELDPGFAMVDDEKEISVLSPLLGSLKKEMPYAVPSGYFENIKSPASKTVEIKKASVIKFSWLRVAAAAVVTGLIVLAAFYFNSNKEPGMKVLAKVTRDVKKMNDSQKDNLLDFMDAGLTGEESVQVSADTKSKIKNMIEDVPEQELKEFQEQTEDLEEVLMTN
jgi:hypothetical protein